MRIRSIKKFRQDKFKSLESVVDDHFFIYTVKGITTLFDAVEPIKLTLGKSCVGSKNHLIRFNKEFVDDCSESIFIKFPKPFLQAFQKRYTTALCTGKSKRAIFPIDNSSILDKYIQSLDPYYDENGILNPKFLDVKRDELLLILLDVQPCLSELLFNFDLPAKVELKRFMSENFRFNISLDQLAYLSGRSLSSFKRDFQVAFNMPPRQWLTNKRLDEAYYLMETQKRKPASFYMDIGFEDLSHFSYAFKERFGISPKQLLKK